MADNSFEKNVGMKMEDFKIHPNEAVWIKVEGQLKKDKRKRRLFYLWLPLLALLTGSTIYLITANSNPKTKPAESKLVQTGTKEKESVTTQPSITHGQKKTADNSVTTGSEPVPGKKPLKDKTTQLPAHQKPGVIKSFAESNNRVKQKNKDLQASLVKKKLLTSETVGLSNEQKPMKDKEELPVKKEAAVHVIKPAVPALLLPYNSKLFAAKKNAFTLNPFTVAGNANEKIAADKSKNQKQKWQLGFQLNAGTGVVKPDLFSPAPSAQRIAGTNTSPAGISTGIITTGYRLKNGLQFGAGMSVRRKLDNRWYFCTGVTYQYSSYKSENIYKFDSLVVSTGMRINVLDQQTKSTEVFHFISIPTELQWKLKKFNNSSLIIAAGIQHSFSINSSKKDSASSLYNSSPASKKSFYQPVLYAVPAYEFNLRGRSLQLGWYFNYGLSPAYLNTGKDHWWQTGLRMQVYFKK